MLVVLGHALEYLRLSDVPTKFIYIWIYEFHMPVFIFISGFFSKNLEKGRNTALRTFAIPFIFFNIILTILAILTGKVESFQFFRPGWTLWYLYCMFLWRLLLPDLVKIRNVFKISLLVGVLYGFSSEFGAYMSMARLLRFLPYFLGGYFVKEAYLLKMRSAKWKYVKAALIIAASLLIAAFWIHENLKPEFFWGDRSYRLLSMELFYELAFGMLSYFIGFGFVFVLMVLAPAKRHFLTVWGERTLTIYLLHVYLIGPLVQATQRIPNAGIHFTILAVASVAIVQLLSRSFIVRWLRIALDRLDRLIMRDPRKKF